MNFNLVEEKKEIRKNNLKEVRKVGKKVICFKMIR